MTELMAIAGAVGGYVLYRKWKTAREYNQKLEPKILEKDPSEEDLEKASHFLGEPGPHCACGECESLYH